MAEANVWGEVTGAMAASSVEMLRGILAKPKLGAHVTDRVGGFAENSVGTADDGLSQVVTVKQGTVTRTTVELPPRIPLFAYRTFREVDPVRSEFLLRLKGQPGQLPQIALLEVDAGKWKHDTMRLVASWLGEQLPDATVIA